MCGASPSARKWRSGISTIAVRLVARYPRPESDGLEPAAWIAQSPVLGKEVAYGSASGLCLQP